MSLIFEHLWLMLQHHVLISQATEGKRKKRNCRNDPLRISKGTVQIGQQDLKRFKVVVQVNNVKERNLVRVRENKSF